ncbi:hypothetical protein DL546_008421 [Coniochaeta pulveracea]|uniref:Spindle pole body component n=1 Tax=Coniochaeta pulveracea TaxID=177199 RepID=A0A420YH88_9PEZI|nr:hypothetical protein DL546_008421 [Coniochaeta pulveracea]
MAQRRGGDSDVFAIPDFWKSSTWLDTAVVELQSEGMFSLDVHREAPEYIVGLVEEKPSEGYFRLPPLLELPPLPDVKQKIEPSFEEPVTLDTFGKDVDDLWLLECSKVKHVPEIKTWATFEQRNEQVPLSTFISEAGPAAFDALLAVEDGPFKILDNDKYLTTDHRTYCASLLNLVLVLKEFDPSCNSKPSSSLSDEQLISLLFDEVHTVEYKSEFLRNTIREVLRAVSKPWTDLVGEWIGLRAEKGIAITKNRPGKGFVRVEDKLWVDDQGFELEEPDYFLNAEAIPSFLPDDVAQEMFETGRNLRFVRDNHPDHRLAKPDGVITANPPKLEWHFDWEAISEVEMKAKEYEQALTCYLEQNTARTLAADDGDNESSTSQGGYDFQLFGKDEGQMADNMLKMFSQPRTPKAIPQDDRLQDVLVSQLFAPDMAMSSLATTDFNPHWSLLPLLSFGPIISAQARIVNKECARLLFSAHNLRSHLRLQRQYHLLGNGLFVSRLSHALFDPDLDTAERRAGIALTGGVMGLRLNGRENWPPASSELRLALMGVLAESYEPFHPTQPSASKTELPPDMDISFAVRDLSPEEIEKCMDPNSLYALDFLRLSYKPPSALRPVMTPIALFKYDRIFRFLLQVLRMLYVVNSLFREIVSRDGNADPASLRLRVEAHHFITRLAAYFFDTGIAGPWTRFEAWLDDLERSLSAPADDGDQERSHTGPDRLRDRHEAVLDEIMDALLLRKRQQPVMQLLEDIFSIVLQFANCWRRRRSGGNDDLGTERLLKGFGKKVDVFTSVCRGLSEKGNGKAGCGEDGGIGRLLLLLDMRPMFAHEAYSEQS